MAADACCGIGEQEESEDDFKALPLLGCAGVGCATGCVESSFVGYSDTFRVVTFGMGADAGDVAHMVYRAIFGDVVMVAAFGESLAAVHGVEGFGGEVASAAGCGAMYHNQGDVSLFNHCLGGWLMGLLAIDLVCWCFGLEG